MSATCILHVEDEESDLILLKLAFEQACISLPLQVAADGQMAIDYLSGLKFPLPCLVLLDLKLPRKSGFEVLEWLRAQPLLRRIVVIVLTSADHELDIIRAFELGANSYVVKPMDIAGRQQMCHLLKDWWLGCNRFPPLSQSPPGA
jgi:DNA-binding response OmpR family regulator